MDMAIVARANVVQLRTAEARTKGIEPRAHDITIRSPGAVSAFRDALISHRAIRSYSPDEIHIRLHEVWGHHCAFCWALSIDDPMHPRDLPFSETDFEPRCASSLALKHDELLWKLWRLRFEHRVRGEAGFVGSPDHKQFKELAGAIPVDVFTKPVDSCDDHALLIAGCEYAGMLAVIRWISDGRMMWGSPDLMEVDETWIAREANLA